MAVVYHPGWDHSIIGIATFTLTDSGGPWTVSFPAGKYCHRNISTLAPTSDFALFSTALTTAMNLSGTSATYTAAYAYAATGPRYTIEVNPGTTTITFPATTAGTLAKNILGFTGTTGPAASHTSNARPFFSLAVQQGAADAYNVINTGARSNAVPNQEPDGIAAMSQADSGATYLITRTTVRKEAIWAQRFEEKRAVYADDAVATLPWTWEHFFQHCRSGNMPFALRDDQAGTETVWRLHGSSVSLRPSFEVSDFDAGYRIPVRAILQGRL